MSLFGNFFKHDARSVVLVDVGSASVAGAYAHFKKGEAPAIVYTKRVPIVPREGRSVAEDMERALGLLTDALITEGAPELARVTGSGRASGVLASISTPWQETVIRTETIEKPKPFTFSHSVLADAMNADTPAEGKTIAEESVVATFLDGYETSVPFGKRASRASVVILSSSLDAGVAEVVTKQLQRAYHTHDVRLTAFAPVAYAVFRDVYPHEKDFLILDVTGEASDLTLVKRGVLVSTLSTPHGTNQLNAAKDDWLGGLTRVLAELSEKYAMPRTLFLLAEDGAREGLKAILDTSPFRTLWLSDEPLAVIPVLPDHLAPFVRTQGLASGDVFLAMLALFERKGIDVAS
jgi:hypothetical protein